jgi:hypothetical protein
MSLENDILNFIVENQEDGKGARSSLNTMIRQAREEDDEKFLKALLKVKEKIKGKGNKFFFDLKTPTKERPSKNVIGRKLKAQRDYDKSAKGVDLLFKTVLENYGSSNKKNKGGMIDHRKKGLFK